MKAKRIALFVVILFTVVLLSRLTMHSEPVSVILDTDVSSDVDDVGAVAVLHSLANEGKAHILAMGVSSGDPWSANCLQVLNTYLGRPGIPVGTVGNKGVKDQSKYTSVIKNDYQQLGFNSGSVVQDAVQLYREVLSSQPDGSVVLVTIGYLTNLKNLLKSRPDEISPLTGTQLVKNKVKRLVTMGGEYPEGREWNFYKDPAATLFVVKHWPTEIVFCGFESGVHVVTGSVLQQTPASNPLRKSYELYNGVTDRASWDQLTVLFAVTGRKGWKNPSGYFQTVEGYNEISADGGNRWKEKGPREHAYTRSERSNAELKKIIETHMLQAVQHSDSGYQH